MTAHDLVIRNAAIVDGTGAPIRHGDVAVTDGVITEVAKSISDGAPKKSMLTA